MLPALAIAAVLLLGTMMMRPLTVVLHELGHAIPAILMTRKSAAIYVGSYGDPTKSLHFRIGLLEVWFRYNPLLWNAGLCIPTATEASFTKQVIWTLTGPLASTIIAGFAAIFILAFDMHALFKAFLMLFATSAVLDLHHNLTPNPNPIRLYDGRVTHNDGYQLRSLFRSRRLMRQWDKAATFYQNKQYREALDILNSLLAQSWHDPTIFRSAIYCCSQLKAYEAMVDLSQRMSAAMPPSGSDLYNHGWALTFLDRHEEAMAIYRKSLELDPANPMPWNNLGYTHSLLGGHLEALTCFEKSIALDPKFTMPLSNRGLTLIRLGRETEGFAEIQKVLDFDPNDPIAHLNLGIYHLERGEFEQALQQFHITKEHWAGAHRMDEWIRLAEAGKAGA